MQVGSISLGLDRSVPTPLYRQLYDSLRLGITQGELKANALLPSERELVLSLGITRPTLRQAFEQLEKEGFVRRQHGVGTFVNDAERWKSARGTFLIGLVTWVPEVSGYQKEILGNLCAETAGQGMDIVTLSSQNDATGVPDLYERILSPRLDGLIAMGTANRRHLRQLDRVRLPKVLLEIRERQEGLDHVVIDSFPGVYGGVSELVRLGHREIGFIGGLIGDHDRPEQKGLRKLAGDSEVRFKAYRHALEDAGIAFRSEWYAELPFTGALVDEWVRDRNARGGLLPAYVAFDDVLAELMIHGLRECGRSVPGDVSVLGFGNITPRAKAGEIATAEFDAKGMARLAVQRLHERIERGGIAGVTLSAESRFKPGGTIGPPGFGSSRS